MGQGRTDHWIGLSTLAIIRPALPAHADPNGRPHGDLQREPRVAAKHPFEGLHLGLAFQIVHEQADAHPGLGGRPRGAGRTTDPIGARSAQAAAGDPGLASRTAERPLAHDRLRAISRQPTTQFGNVNLHFRQQGRCGIRLFPLRQRQQQMLGHDPPRLLRRRMSKGALQSRPRPGGEWVRMPLRGATAGWKSPMSIPIATSALRSRASAVALASSMLIPTRAALSASRSTPISRWSVPTRRSPRRWASSTPYRTALRVEPANLSNTTPHSLF